MVTKYTINILKIMDKTFIIIILCAYSKQQKISSFKFYHSYNSQYMQPSSKEVKLTESVLVEYSLANCFN